MQLVVLNKMANNETRYLRKVSLDADVYAFCLQHALTTEKQEVMGLLIGEVLSQLYNKQLPCFWFLSCR